MRQLSPAGQQAIDDIARRHGVSTDAALTMLDAVVRGNGGMAQFSHPEFSGSGQWMRGGMTMVSDMFNHGLKARVDALCQELADLVAREPGLLHGGSFQSQSQNGQHQYHGSGMAAPAGPQGGSATSLFAPAPADWWGESLRWPNSTGAQNGMRYAYFAQARRLAVEASGQVTIYDTLDHQIGGVSQQQSGGTLLAFSSQYGNVDLASLPVVSGNGQALAADVPAPMAVPATSGGHTQDIFATIERLAELRAKGVLDETEFQAKKTELLGRL